MLRRPGRTLAVTLLCVGVLGVLGLGVEDRLQPTSLTVPGTASARGQALADANFGQSSPFAILLRGPAAAIEHQGPGLVAALRRRSDALVISPWEDGPAASILPKPAARGRAPEAASSHALILADFHLPLDEAMRHTVPALERTLAARIHPPLLATQSGYASVSRGLQEESLSATQRAELIAAPLLLLVLLAVFRSVVAAAIPLALGAMTVLAGRGVLALLSSSMRIDALSLVVCTMMGLALGVDYSLFIVSRFREELGRGRGPRDAALATRRSAGRTTVFAGSTLFVSIFFSAFLQPGSLLVSLAVALVTVTAISVLLAWVALPALLVLLGLRINAGRIGSRRQGAEHSRVAAAAAAALRRPALAAAVIAIPLVLLAAPALAVNTGAPGVDELPSGSKARRSAETIDAAVGPGWEAPFVLVAAAQQGPISTRGRLALLARWQRHIAAQPDVKAVIGPAPIARGARPLRTLGQTLVSSADGPISRSPGDKSAHRRGGLGGLARLGPGLHRASAAVARLRRGIGRAAAGSGLLGEGASRAQVGAGLIASGLGRAAAGGERASAAIDRLATGSGRLSNGQHRAAVAGLTLTLGLRALLPSVRGNALARARRLATQLEATARGDPGLRPQANQARVLARTLASTRDEVKRLRAVAISLNGGLGRLASGGKRLRDGSARLAGAAAGLSGGLARLGAGAERLASGLGALRGGAGALQSGLGEGFHRSYPLQAGLRRAGVRVSSEATPLLRGARELRRNSPHLFDSGYFVLSALDAAPPRRRALAGEAINVAGGGQAARMLIVSDQDFNTAGSREVGAALLADSQRLGSEGHLQTGLTGGAATLNDYGAATKGRLPLVIGTVVLVTFLMLVAILRAPLLAALAVGLNLASVGAAIGVVSLICKVPAGYPLGGHSYIDTVGAAAIFGVTFGLSIDYAVFLIARMRESYERDGDNAAAIRFGLEKTAGVITGAAAIMAAVFVSFAAAPIATVSQMGVGLTVAILLDATVVRIVLLPALMLLLGDRVWRVPAWLDRVLPQLNVHGMEAKA
jgi:RND superfamily putative drug exporter